MTDRALDLSDIQGAVIAGFNTDIQVLMALHVPQVTDFPRAAAWLAAQAPALTVVSEVRANRERMKSATAHPPLTWLGVAVGQRILQATQPDVLVRDDAFNGGMIKRAPSVLGDKTNPATWRVGSTAAALDVLLLVAGNDEAAVQERADQVSASAAGAALETNYRETARRIDDREHFGFRDGISQPKVIGDEPGGELGAGHFVFGYPKKAGEAPYSPVVDPRGITDNGSLLVFRRLVQDVAAFRIFCEEQVARISPQWPGLTQAHFAALLVGRWPSGAPLRSGQTQDPGGPPDNAFDFQDDADARSCPFGAHIRKVNPRKGPKDVVEVPRMLRRGIPFGPAFASAPDQSERGLAFLAFQTSLKSQFEFLTQHWMNSPLNPARGSDLLVGRADSVRSMVIAGPNGPIEVGASDTHWIVPTGGAYLFLPGRSALAKFDTPPAAAGLWTAKRAWARAADSVRSLFN